MVLRRVILAGGVLAAGGLLASCDPYPMAGDPGAYPYPDPGPPPMAGPGYPPQAGQMVEVLGCVRPGVESRCAILQGTDGSTWDVSGLQPSPILNGEWAVRARGRAAVGAMGYCQQGMILSEATYEYANVRCVQGRVQGY